MKTKRTKPQYTIKSTTLTLEMFGRVTQESWRNTDFYVVFPVKGNKQYVVEHYDPGNSWTVVSAPKHIDFEKVGYMSYIGNRNTKYFNTLTEVGRYLLDNVKLRYQDIHEYTLKLLEDIGQRADTIAKQL